jgi:hypothetical protein
MEAAINTEGEDNMDQKKCPCCGEPIMAGQEECLNCRVYLMEVEDAID